MSKRSRSGFYKKINIELNKNLALLSQECICEERDDVINNIVSTKDVAESRLKSSTPKFVSKSDYIDDDLNRDILEDNLDFVDISDSLNKQLENKNDLLQIQVHLLQLI